jgi:hypothetical protein
MMKKSKTMLLVLFVICGICASIVSNASAEEWLFEGKSISTEKPGLLDWKMLALHEGGLLGDDMIECTYQLHGDFGPGKKHITSQLLGLKGESNTIKCEFTEGACGAGSAASVTALHLGWSSELLLPGTPSGTWALISEGTGKASPGFETECTSLKLAVKCEGTFRAKFIENGANGAIFEFKGTESFERSCSDGGKLILEGKGEALDFTMS